MRRTLIVILIFLTVSLAGCGFVIDSEGTKFGSAREFAEATHIAQMSEDAAMATRQAVELEATRTTANIRAEATRAAIAAQAQQAEADKAKSGAVIEQVKAETEQGAQDAATAAKRATYILAGVGTGLGAFILFVGLASGFSAWLHKRATTVYPNKQGQFPLLPERGPGYTIYHDPNRALGPGTVMRTPGLIERASYTVALMRGKAPAIEPGAEYPQPADVHAMLQVTSQAQASQLQIAEKSGRPKFMFTVTPQPGPQEQKPAKGRMPPIAFVNDPDQIESFERKLLEAGDK